MHRELTSRLKRYNSIFLKKFSIHFQTKVPYQYVELNPYKNRENEEWKRINPAGKVPAITVNDEKPGLPESRQCLEFINEVSKVISEIMRINFLKLIYRESSFPMIHF